jgi:hypothetical protein
VISNADVEIESKVSDISVPINYEDALTDTEKCKKGNKTV